MPFPGFGFLRGKNLGTASRQHPRSFTASDPRAIYPLRASAVKLQAIRRRRIAGIPGDVAVFLQRGHFYRSLIFFKKVVA
jgi:hypothetical protein